MLAISSVLGKLVADHHKYALSSGRDSRMLVPGLTNRISREIHEYLRGKGITAYLVIGDDLLPDEEKSWIRPIGLTSKRIGSFVATACPGQLAHIQDSIRGSGGAIRSVTFSEEWPWIDVGTEAFRFCGTVLRDLVALWTDDEDERKWLTEFVLSGLLPSTRSSSQRTGLLLEDILGDFSSSLYPELDDIRLKILFHAGVPRTDGNVPLVPALLRNTSRLCNKIVERCRKEEGARQQALEMVLKVIPSGEQAIAREALSILLDGIGQSKTLDLGILAFFSCWAGNVAYWSVLNASRLERIFEIEVRQPAEVTCAVECERAIVSAQGNALATFHGEDIRFSGTYKIPPDEFERHTWTLSLTYRRSVLENQELETPEGNFSFLIESDSAFNRYRSALPLKISLLADEETRAEGRIRLYLCGTERPAFALVDPVFEVVDASTPTEEETPDKKIESNEASHVYLFSHDDQEPTLLDGDEIELPIIETGQQGIWRSSEKIDPLDDPSGQVTRICQFGPLVSIINFEAKDIERGEFTIEDELRVQIAGKRESNLQELVTLFGGESREPYRRLGKINELSRKRILLANDVTVEQGWRPLLADLLGSNLEEAGSLGDFVNSRGQVEAPAFTTLTLPEPALLLLREYSSCRYSIIEAIQANLDSSGSILDHPDYASCPLYVDSRSTEMNGLMVRYLTAYRQLLNYVRESRASLEWSQLFVLIYLDCVVHWDGSVLKNSFFLIGPWHPMVLAKRYMIQAALWKRAKGLEETNGKVFRQLAVLIKGITGFRWLVGLHRDDRLLESLYVTPTSDPGWHLAIKPDLTTVVAQTSLGTLGNLLENLRDRFGLESSILQGGTEDLAHSALSNFLRAYPSRRSLGMRIRKGYSSTEILTSVDRFLREGEEQTEQGSQLPGGIHLFFQEPLAEFVGGSWSAPPVLMYQFDNDDECFREAAPDIYLLAPTGEVSFRQAEERSILPRGQSLQAAFYEPLCWLTEGQAQLPNSACLEHDEAPEQVDDPGTAFVGVSASVSAMPQNRMLMVRSVDLPQRLPCPWAVVPGGEVDPAVFVKYVRDGASRAIQDRALWDYRLDITGSRNTYYVLSIIPKGFGIAVNGFFDSGNAADQFIEDLGALGIAIGGEALKSGRHALGVVGLVGTIRLLKGIGGSSRGIFHEGNHCLGFLIPVDSFISFFGGKARGRAEERGDFKRTDLLAIQLVLPKDNASSLGIYACGIESKFVSQTFSQARAMEALRQAQASLEQFRLLVETSRQSWAMSERLGVLAIIRFGLRITSPSRQVDVQDWMEIERIVFGSILQGKYEFREAKYDAIVVSTEGQLPGVAESNSLPEGLWVRITRDHWPGINDTPQLEAIREELSEVFDIPSGSCGSAEVTGQTPSPAPESAEASPAETGSETSPVESATLPESGVDSETPVGETQPRSDSHEETATTVGPSVGTGPLRRIFLGVDNGRRPVFYDPQSPVDPLDNMNLMITGSSGTGKTQLLKYLICKLREQQKNVLILDFKNDFASDVVFASRADLERVFVSFDGLPFNPLIPYPLRHPGTGELVVQSGQHISGVAAVLKRTYGLGPQQQIAVKNAIVDSFTALGIPTAGTTRFSPEMDFPDLNNVGVTLEGTNQLAYNRLDPLFTLDLFRTEYRQHSFHALVNRSIILDLSQIPSDQIKNTLAELIVLSAHAYYNAQPHSGAIRQLLVFDEAHRVLTSDYMTSLVRECRAYGVGTVLSSQYPADFPAEISGSTATKILHSNGRDADKVRAIAQLIGCVGREAEISGLDRFQAFIDNRHSPHTLVRTMNYPLYLVWSQLASQNEISREAIAQVEGIDTDKLPAENLIKQLERLGLAEEREGFVRLLRRYE